MASPRVARLPAAVASVLVLAPLTACRAGDAFAQQAVNPGGIVVERTATQQRFHALRKVANTDACVLISGESGAGKELTALAIHERSPRRKAQLTAINCGTIPRRLLQSELFGYKRGAFPDANQRKIGRVAAADGGILLLDEIGDLPLEKQAGLLRFLREGKIERLGGRDSIPVGVRIISATHVDLEGAMHDGHYRVDLFHRLGVLRVDEPPLRARRPADRLAGCAAAPAGAVR